jgi:hypothetical protein|tara:strand:- start:1196 stop:1510 length:315 start_codon:yes stop_codon:yes gene_type:complete
MVKYLSIPVSGAGNQILQVFPLIMCETVSTTSTIIDFAGFINGDRATITHSAMAANDHSIRIAFTNAMAESMKSSYTSVVFPLDLKGINAADGTQVVITNISFI